MKIRSIKKEKQFIPLFNGNQELDPSDQIVINIKSFPTNSQVSTYKNYKGDGSGSVELVYRDDIMLMAHVGLIRNLADDDGPIDNGTALSRSTNLLLSDLIAEIRDYLLNTEELDQGEG